LRLKPDKKV